MNDIDTVMQGIGTQAKAAAAQLAYAQDRQKTLALDAAAKSVWDRRAWIIDENAKDLEYGRQKGLSDAMMDRLLLDEARIKGIVDGLTAVAQQADPVGKVLGQWDRPNGLSIKKVSTPLGVIGVIYESRPNVTADAGALCLKSGNAVILRGGSESFHSSQALHSCLVDGLKEGIVHIYIDKHADAEKTLEVVLNSKTRRTGICGAAECLLIHQDLVDVLGAEVISALIQAGVEVRANEDLSHIAGTKEATAEDWGKEYLASTIAARSVRDIDQAIAHIRTHGSNHTDCIMTEDDAAKRHFFERVDSAILMHNASTQFADGGEFGMGAEIGIATGKMHARGPVGTAQLTSFKYLVSGNGAVRT